MEFQLITDFFADYVKRNPRVDCYAPVIKNYPTCNCLKSFWYQVKPQHRPVINGVEKDPIDHVGYEFPGTGNAYLSEFVLLQAEVNSLKEGLWGTDPARNEYTLQDYAGWGNNLFQYVKNSISNIKYHIDPTIRGHLVRQKNRIGARLNLLENTYLNTYNKPIDGQQRTWKPLGLQAEWNTFVRGKAATAITQAFTLVENSLRALEDGYATPAQRNLANRGGPDAQNEKDFIAKIDALRAEWTNNRPTWNNPF